MMRYAIYFLPDPASALWAFGCSVIGYDAMTGIPVARPDHPDLRETAGADTRTDPRRYGFHATLKAPFVLRDGATENDLRVAVDDVAARRSRFVLPGLHVSAIGSFLALVPNQPDVRIDALAADCVTAFEPFRAPLSPADRQRRLKAPLTLRQTELLETWGYPYVLDEFRFHMDSHRTTARTTARIGGSGTDVSLRTYFWSCRHRCSDVASSAKPR